MEENDRGLRVLFYNVRERDGGTLQTDTLRTNNIAYIIQVYKMANMSSHGIMNIITVNSKRFDSPFSYGS